MINKIPFYLTLTSLLLLFTACSNEREPKYHLNCILTGVVNIDSGKTTYFTKQNAIKNGYVYDLIVSDDGLIVNKKDHYRLDVNATHSFSLLLNNKIVKNFVYKFNKDFSDVELFLVKRHEKYTYDCTSVNQ